MNTIILAKKLEKFPALKNRLEIMLEVSENTSG